MTVKPGLAASLAGNAVLVAFASWLILTRAPQPTPQSTQTTAQHAPSAMQSPVVTASVDEEKILTLEDAVRKMTSAVAERLSIHDRGQLHEGFFADLMIFDPNTIIDRATYERPHQLSVGVRYVLVNGVLVVDGAKVTGAKPGMIVRGPGWVAR